MSAVPLGEGLGATRLPPGPPLPRAAQGLAFAALRQWMLARCADRYGSIFTIDLPVFGRTVVVADPHAAKQVFVASSDELINIQPNLSKIMGPGCVFALDRAEHRERRKLLMPPLHGKSIKNHERIFEEETRREIATWPEGEPIPTLEPMMRITLNVILRAVFGAEGVHFDALRRLLPPWVKLGSTIATLPPLPYRGRFSPWGRFVAARKSFDAVVAALIDEAEKDPRFDERTDILSLLLRSTYDDGSSMSRRDISDELVALLTAGHETTASTLAFVFERITRHADVLARLAAEAETDDHTYRQATILETQRARTVIDLVGRQVASSAFQVGPWVLPRGATLMVSITQMHERSEEFPHPERFDPDRFVETRPPMFAWLPYGGGARRCVGAAFANLEMDIVLRTVLRHVVLDPTNEPAEKVHFRGVAYAPKDGGRVVVRRRRA